MTERRIERALGAVHVPGEADAERRAAALAADAFAARPPVVVERSHALRAVALAAAACLARSQQPRIGQAGRRLR